MGCCALLLRAYLKPCSHYNAEPRLAAHHPFVCLRSSLEWKHFGHGPHACQRAESEGVLRIDRAARGPACDRAARGDQQASGHFERLIRVADEDEFPADAQAAQDGVHRFSAGDRRQNDLSPAQFFQLAGGVLRLAVHIMVRAEFFRERLFIFSSGDGDSLKTHFRGKLDAHVTEAADSEYGDQISWPRSAISQCIECCDARAKQRPCLYRGKLAWNQRKRTSGGDHVVRVTSIAGQTRDLPRLAACHEITAAARVAIAAMSAVPADSDSLPHFPPGNARAHSVDDSRDLMPGDARVLDPRPRAFFGIFIAVADAARLHFNPYRSGNRLRNVELHELKGTFRARYLYCPHLRHDSSKIRSPPLERWCAHYSRPSDLSRNF